MRIDYFSIMREWRVRLYRYGLRMPYEIAVPEPAAALREDFKKLYQLQQPAIQAFSFNVLATAMSDQNPPPTGKAYYLNLESQFGASVPEPSDQE
jgi:hypothetical protein